jgi:hypothetical protein
MLFARSRFSCYCLFPLIKERLRCTHFPGYENFINVLDVNCETQGRLKLMTELYVSEKSVINTL